MTARFTGHRAAYAACFVMEEETLAHWRCCMAQRGRESGERLVVAEQSARRPPRADVYAAARAEASEAV